MKKADKKEEIILDVVLGNEVDYPTFQASLANGHEIVAFPAKIRDAAELDLHPGQRVKVKLSPYDMFKGIILKETN